MDCKPSINSSNKLVEKLNKTTQRIQKARKNTKKAEKEAAEFNEIHKLLKTVDVSESAFSKPESPSEEGKSSDCSTIPVTYPGLKVFHDEFIFSLFREQDCCLRKFINPEEKCSIFGKNESIPSEECFRKLIAYHVTENLMPSEGSCSSISLYVFYLMSVHKDYDFVEACFDFLTFRKFLLQPEDIFPVFINFGAKDLFEICGESTLKKFQRAKNDGENTQLAEFPFFNVEMVGRILLQYITDNLLVINSHIQPLVQGLVKITLDPKIRSGCLLSLFSTILTDLCARIQQQDYTLEEILSWIYLNDEHLLNQVEICRIVSRPIFPDLQEGLVLKTLSRILKSHTLRVRPPIKINHLKSTLKKLRNRELPALELYSLLQLINGSLPGLTATVKDSTEINALLACLEQKISKTVDSVDLIRLKLEIAKVGNLVTNNINNGFTVHETIKKSSVKKIRKLGGRLRGNGKEEVTHVVVEDSVAEDKEKCLAALKKHGLEARRDVKYVKVKWISKCLNRKGLADTKPFEILWVGEALGLLTSSTAEGAGPERKEEEEENDGESPGKKQKIENEKFICSKPSSSNETGTSQKKKIIEELEKLANAYSIRNDTWRSHSYRKAINAIMLHEKDISTYQEAAGIPGVGEKMASKIMEIIESGTLRKVEEIVDEKTKILDVFCKIWGVGPSTAEAWYVQGFRTLEDLRTGAKLTKQQQIGLKLYDDLQERIPREEVVKIADIVEIEVKKIHSSLTVELVGSFRRGKSTCGDVDVMIVNPGVKGPLEILHRVTEGLKDKGYLSDDLVTLEDSENSEEENHHKKYLGVFKLPGESQTHRRIDLFVVPKSEYASALMHYTGSALFNRSIKLLASKQNKTLTERGLYAGTVRKGSEVTCKGQLVTTLTEEDIFKELGLPYRHPEERDH